MTAATPPFVIGGETVAPGERRTIDLPIGVMSNHTPMALPVHVVHGRRPGPVLFVSAAIHGDEIIGVEIIRRLLRAPLLRGIAGTLLAIPIVNAYGFISRSRYFPDRRDLNRSFPGSANGSLAAQVAHVFMTEIVAKADFGIDLHSAAVHRINLPQVRISEPTGRVRELADAFGAPVVLASRMRDGSLRMAASKAGVGVMIFEGGEGLRFDEFAARVGTTGVLRVMRALDMVAARPSKAPALHPAFASASHWLRAPAGGLLRTCRKIGDGVARGEVIAAISDPFGAHETEIVNSADGVLIGRTNLPVVNQGDALFHIAQIARPTAAAGALKKLEEDLQVDPMFDEDEIL
jgi:hypothetical protein